MEAQRERFLTYHFFMFVSMSVVFASSEDSHELTAAISINGYSVQTGDGDVVHERLISDIGCLFLPDTGHTMKLRITNFFRRNKSSIHQSQKDDSTQEKQPEELDFNFHTINIKQDSEYLKKSKSVKHVRKAFETIKKTASINNLKATLHRTPHSHPSSFVEKQAIQTELNTGKKQHQDYNTEIEYFDEGHCNRCLTSSVFEHELSSSNKSYFVDTTPVDGSYSGLYTLLYSDYYPDSESAQSSMISYKENVPPEKYLLSPSGTANYAITPDTPKLKFFPIFGTVDTNPFTTTDIEYPYNLPRNATPKDDYHSIDYLAPHNYNAQSEVDLPLNTVNPCVFTQKSNPPLHQLPVIPTKRKSKSSSKLSATYDAVLNEVDIADPEFDIEEKSLFDALSNVELWDYSKIKLVSYHQ